MDQENAQHSFTMKTNYPEGQAFLEALDRLRLSELPVRSRSEMLRKLVFEADRKRARK